MNVIRTGGEWKTESVQTVRMKTQNLRWILQHRISNILIFNFSCHSYFYVSGLNNISLKVAPPHVEALWEPGGAATSSPVTKTVCLQGKCWATTVHFGQQNDVVTLWLSHQELAVERNVDVGEELLQGRVGVQEQQPDGSRWVCIFKRL